MKVTATMALVALREMNIAGTDEKGGKAIGEKVKERLKEMERLKEKAKEKEGGSRKHAGHLALPVWNTNKVSTTNWLHRDRSCANVESER